MVTDRPTTIEHDKVVDDIRLLVLQYHMICDTYVGTVEAPQRAVCATTNIKHIRKNSPGYKDGDTANTHVVAIVDYTLKDQRLSSAKTKDYIYRTVLSWQWAAPLWCPCETTHVALLGDSYVYRIT